MLRVKTMGGFQLFWDNRPISLGKQSGSNIIRLFMLLMLYLEKGVSRERLIRALFYEQMEDSDVGANLRITVYRLRKALDKAGVIAPKGEELILAEQGLYQWNPKVPVWVDIREFDRLAEMAVSEADPEKSLAIGESALKLCEGDFLPALSTEEWVNACQVRYGGSYRRLFTHLYQILTDKKDHQRAWELASRAASLYPYEEYQIFELDCLIALGRFDDALQLYEETAKLYFQEMGLEPSEEMSERFRKISDHNQVSAVSLEGIRQRLKDSREQSHGPYYCALPSFIDNFRFVQRILERTGQSAYIEVIMLEDSSRMPLPPQEPRTIRIARILEECISHSLRKGDLVTKYNGSTFLLLLMCTNEKGCTLVEERITQKFRTACSFKKVRLGFRNFPVMEVSNLTGFVRARYPGVIRLCIEEAGGADIKGRAYTLFRKDPILFDSFTSLLKELNLYFDQVGYPQAETSLHSLKEEEQTPYNIPEKKPVTNFNTLMTRTGKTLTVNLMVSHRKRSTWQGSVKFPDTEEEYTFISELQLLKILLRGLEEVIEREQTE